MCSPPSVPKPPKPPPPPPPGPEATARRVARPAGQAEGDAKSALMGLGQLKIPLKVLNP